MLKTDSIYLSQIFQILLFPFMLGLLTLSYMPEWTSLMAIFGIFYLSIYILFIYFLKIKIQTEIILYIIWVMWSMTGFFIATNQVLFYDSLRTIIQMAALILIISGITSLKGNLKSVLYAIILAGWIIAAESFLAGEFMLNPSEVDLEPRAAGIIGNPNEFAHHLLYVIFAIFFLMDTTCSRTKRIFLLSAIFFTVVAIVFSGSRQGLIGLIIFMGAWFYNTKGKKFKQNPLLILFLTIALVCIIYFFVTFILTNTYMGERLADAENENSRIQMYLDAFNIVRENPIFGIGLDNFRVFSTSGKYSHSDYMEVMTNTGIIGFFLYFSIYYILWRRLQKLRSNSRDATSDYYMGVIRSSLITILILGFVQPYIKFKLPWIFIAGIAGYLWHMNEKPISVIEQGEN